MTKKIILCKLCIILSALFSISNVFGQEKTLAEKLGYSPDARLLIIHADDAGVSHAENMATFSAFEKHCITSSSIMVPCPWFPEAAAYAKAHPEFDFGIHITLTAEWEYYKWSGVLSSDRIPGLLNKQGYFYPSEQDVAKHADPKEVEKEVRSQIDRAIAFGIKPTHLDSHMGSIFRTPELFKVYLKLGQEYHLPVFIPLNMISQYPQLKEFLPPGIVFVDNLYMMSTGVAPQDWHKAYEQMIKSMKPGLNELIIHLAMDNDEMKAVTVDHPDFGAAWRQRDFNFITGNAFKQMLEENNIIPVTWRQINELMYKNK